MKMNIAPRIPDQFPSIYREEKDALFVEFVKAYYEFMDEGGYSDIKTPRDISIINDIDRAVLDENYSRFLRYFKSKFLKTFPAVPDDDLPFVIKNIHDLYRRKGTSDGIRLYFRMFFEIDVLITYPGINIIKPSNSVYYRPTYLEMYNIRSIEDYPLKAGMKIVGHLSKAEALVESVIFRRFDNNLTPIVLLSDLVGDFLSVDRIRLKNSLEQIPVQIRGSLSGVNINLNSRRAGNKVGERLKVVSSANGIGGEARVSKISVDTSGLVDFKLEDGGYGYSLSNDIYVSNQTIIVETNETDLSFDELETITAGASQGQVISYEYPTLNVMTTDTNKFDSEVQGFTITKADNSTFQARAVNPFNDSASFIITELNNAETISIIPDKLADFLSVPLNSTDYGMSGVGVETQDTIIEDAFTEQTLEIGSISNIQVVDPGIDYINDVSIIVKNPLIESFDGYNYLMEFSQLTSPFRKGEVITQDIPGKGIAKAIFVSRSGNTNKFRQTSFLRMRSSLPVLVRENLVDIRLFGLDRTSKKMGGNAIITGISRSEVGRIEEIKITESGYNHRSGDLVSLINSEGAVVATGTCISDKTGKSIGSWLDRSSFLNERTKRIRDNDYYQEFSYEIQAPISDELYKEAVENHVSMAGTKMFTGLLINTNNTNLSPSLEFEVTQVNA